MIAVRGCSRSGITFNDASTWNDELALTSLSTSFTKESRSSWYAVRSAAGNRANIAAKLVLASSGRYPFT